MSESNTLELFQNATKGFFSLVFNQLQDGIVCLNKDRRILFWNKAAEQNTGFESADAVGKQCFEELPLFLDREGANICRTACPVEQTLKDGAIRMLDVYLQHKDGFRVQTLLRVIPVFQESGEIIGAVEAFSNTVPKVTIPLSIADLEKMALIDSDTGISGRQYLDMTLNIRLEEFRNYGLPFGLIYVDVDNYTKTLEKYGRFNAGKVLRTVAKTLHKNVRYFDIVGRWDVEEFLVILLNIDESRLDIVANKLRLLISESYITTEMGMLSATVSMGASIVQRYDTLDALVKRAEQLMLHSKWLGKNKVSLSFVQKNLL